MLGEPVGKYKSNKQVIKPKFKRVGYDFAGMYYRLNYKNFVRYNKDVVEIVDSLPEGVEFVKVKDLVAQVPP